MIYLENIMPTELKEACSNAQKWLSRKEEKELEQNILLELNDLL
jgi:hypothetical protein